MGEKGGKMGGWRGGKKEGEEDVHNIVEAQTSINLLMA